MGLKWHGVDQFIGMTSALWGETSAKISQNKMGLKIPANRGSMKTWEDSILDKNLNLEVTNMYAVCLFLIDFPEKIDALFGLVSFLMDP